MKEQDLIKLIRARGVRRCTEAAIELNEIRPSLLPLPTKEGGGLYFSFTFEENKLLWFFIVNNLAKHPNRIWNMITKVFK